MKNKAAVIFLILALCVCGLAFAEIQNTITLDVKGMDLVDVLKMLATRSGMNVVIGKNVTGRVTLFLKEVNVSDAFEIVILANELAYEKKDGILNVMTARDYEMVYGQRFDDKNRLVSISLKYARAANLLQVLNQVKTNIGKIVVDEPSNTVIIIDVPPKLKEMSEIVANLDRPLKTEIFGLNYAQADKINSKLQEALTKGIGTLRIDERTNKIVVTDYPEKLEEIGRVIRAFDEKTMQVLIDAQIIEITPNKDEFSMGVDWDYWIKNNINLIAPLAAPALTGASTIGTKIAMGVAAGDQTVNPGKTGEYKAIINALRVIGETKIISSPRIMALNNQEAKILVGTKDAYITSTTTQGGSGNTVTSQQVNFVDVGIKLYVTPTINRDNFVTLKVRPEISSSTRTSIISEGQTTQVPIVTTSESETTIMIKDGTTIMIAGLKKDKREREIKKIPILGDIPVLDIFFSNRRRELTKTELVIFITPHIVSGEEPLEYNSINKDKEINDIVKKSLESYKLAKFSEDKSDDAGDLVRYKALIFDKIKAIFSQLQRESGARGVSVISFKVNAQGGLTEPPRCLTPEQQNSLDIIAIKSIEKASPFPPLPKALGKDQERFEITFDAGK